MATRASGTLIQNTSRQVFSAHTTAMPYSGPEHAAEFLRGTDAAEDGRPVALRPQVGGQRERDGQQRTAGDALDDAADDQDRQVRRTTR